MNEQNPPLRETGLHPLLPVAISHHQAGRLQEAAQIYRAILRESPEEFDARHLLGVVALQEGRLEEAANAIGSALKLKPEDQAALANLTAVHLRAGNFSLAAEVGERASKLLPPSVDALINYGTALHQLERYREAIPPLEVAQFLNPRSIEVCNLLGACLLKIGDNPRAVTIFTIATHVSPQDSASWANLSVALNASSDHERALACAERAVTLGRDPANALEAQASAHFEMGKIEESVAIYRQALDLGPTVRSLRGLARALLGSGRHDEAIATIHRAIELDRSDLYVRILLVVAVLKPVYNDIPEMQESRAAFHRAMLDLNEWLDRSPAQDAYVQVGALQPFFIAYHPFNNRDLLSQFGDISVRLMNSLPNANSSFPAVSRQGKMRLGIVSAHIFNQSVWLAILKGWVQEIDKSLFDVFLFKLGTEKDSETGKAAQHATHFDDTPKSTANWAEAIRGANLDALIFDEVGMDASTLQLASLRLVPLQCATWGHPETTGLSTIDAYISGEAIEPSNGQDNYRERLIKLPNLGVYVEPLAPKFVEPNLRELGLPKDEPLLLCAGSPFKYMPIHDWVWTKIARGLRAHGKGRLVFFSTSRGSMHVMLLDRLRRAFDQAGLEFDACVCVVPFLDRPRYYGVMRAATLMLDTLEFSGFNTAMQAIECDLPYLAFEGQFMRGRLASGLLRTMKLAELVANDYEQFAQRAVALGTNTELISKLRAEIAARRHVLFHDSEPIRGLERFLATEIARRRAN